MTPNQSETRALEIERKPEEMTKKNEATKRSQSLMGRTRGDLSGWNESRNPVGQASACFLLKGMLTAGVLE